VVAIERRYSNIVELIKHPLAQTVQENPKSLRSNLQSATRTAALSATK
jgi:hypothetical protein